MFDSFFLLAYLAYRAPWSTQCKYNYSTRVDSVHCMIGVHEPIKAGGLALSIGVHAEGVHRRCTGTGVHAEGVTYGISRPQKTKRMGS